MTRSEPEVAFSTVRSRNDLRELVPCLLVEAESHHFRRMESLEKHVHNAGSTETQAQNGAQKRVIAFYGKSYRLNAAVD
jgi:hypothetical protein